MEWALGSAAIPVAGLDFLRKRARDDVRAVLLCLPTPDGRGRWTVYLSVQCFEGAQSKMESPDGYWSIILFLMTLIMNQYSIPTDMAEDARERSQKS
jgi:hypothetical protein